MTKKDVYEISLLLKQVQHRKLTAVDDALMKLECSLSQWVILRRIERYPGASAHTLAQSAFQTDQSFGAITKRLIDRGLVVREQGKGRAFSHRLSEAGISLLKLCNPVVKKTLEEKLQGLDEDELETFGDLLAKIAAHSA